jgi:hypothetical protein
MATWVPLNYSGTIPDHAWFRKGRKGLQPCPEKGWVPSENWNPDEDTVFVRRDAFLRDPDVMFPVPNDFRITHAAQYSTVKLNYGTSEDLPAPQEHACPFVPNLGVFHLITTKPISFSLTARPHKPSLNFVKLIPMAAKKVVSGLVIYSTWEPRFMEQFFAATDCGLIIAPVKHLRVWHEVLTRAGINCFLYNSLHDPLQTCHVHLVPPGFQELYAPGSLACHKFKHVTFYEFVPSDYIFVPSTERKYFLRPAHCKRMDILMSLLPWSNEPPVNVKAMDEIFSKMTFVLNKIIRKCRITWLPQNRISCSIKDVPLILQAMQVTNKPLSPERVAALGSQLDQCPVCHDTMPLGDISLFPCGHMLCGECESLLSGNACPVCRQGAKSKTRRHLSFLDEQTVPPNSITVKGSSDHEVAEAISQVPDTEDVNLLFTGKRRELKQIKQKIQARKDMIYIKYRIHTI